VFRGLPVRGSGFRVPGLFRVPCSGFFRVLGFRLFRFGVPNPDPNPEPRTRKLNPEPEPRTRNSNPEP
jgi:hypothetical protein